MAILAQESLVSFAVPCFTLPPAPVIILLSCFTGTYWIVVCIHGGGIAGVQLPAVGVPRLEVTRSRGIDRERGPRPYMRYPLIQPYSPKSNFLIHCMMT